MHSQRFGKDTVSIFNTFQLCYCIDRKTWGKLGSYKNVKCELALHSSVHYTVASCGHFVWAGRRLSHTYTLVNTCPARCSSDLDDRYWSVRGESAGIGLAAESLRSWTNHSGVGLLMFLCVSNEYKSQTSSVICIKLN